MREYGKKMLRHYATGALPSGVVLLYHRVADLETDPQLLAVSLRNFGDHLEVLRHTYQPVRLTDLRHHARGLPRRVRPIALTFDDGYADNLHGALPLLRTAGIPATAFVVAGQVGRVEEFWWDELERILLGTPDLPEWLEVTIGSNVSSWHFPRGGDQPDRDWNVLDQPRSPRQGAYQHLCELLRPVSAATRTRVLESLRSWAKVEGSGRAKNRALAEEEVAALATDGLVEVGSHTLTHPVLSRQPEAIQKQEIEASKHRLEDILNAPVQSFSYPFGRHSDYTSATVRLVKDAGYALACSNHPGKVYWGTDRYRIPRFVVRDWNADEFARWLDASFDG